MTRFASAEVTFKDTRVEISYAVPEEASSETVMEPMNIALDALLKMYEPEHMTSGEINISASLI